ncbi:MAG: hypothetical protein D6739_08365, partial [Nitrospirae bacterium]
MRRGGLLAFLKRRINPLAADREEKYARLEARVASGVATGDQYNQLGDMKLEKGLREDALELYKQASDQFIEEDLIVKSIAVIKKIVKQFPDDVCITEMYLRLGDLNQRRGMVANAKEAYLVAAQQYQEQGAIREALGVFQRLADLLPENVDLNADLGRMYAKEGMKEEASAQFARTALRLIDQGDLRRARELCLSSLAQRSNNRDALKGLLHIAMAEEDYAEADAYMKRLGDYVADDWELLKSYGDLLLHQGRREEAVEQYRRAAALNPMNQEIEAALRRAGAHGEAELPEEAGVVVPGTPEAAPEADGPVVELDPSVLEEFDPAQLLEEAERPEPTPEEAPPAATAGPAAEPEAEPHTEAETEPPALELEGYAAVFQEDEEATEAVLPQADEALPATAGATEEAVPAAEGEPEPAPDLSPEE